MYIGEAVIMQMQMPFLDIPCIQCGNSNHANVDEDVARQNFDLI